jgi:hypothetical protein
MSANCETLGLSAVFTHAARRTKIAQSLSLTTVVRTVSAAGGFRVPLALIILVLDGFGVARDFLLAGGRLCSGERIGMGREAFGKHAVDLIGPAPVVLDKISCGGATKMGCPLYPQKLPRHSLTGVSVTGQKQTHALQQKGPSQTRRQMRSRLCRWRCRGRAPLSHLRISSTVARNVCGIVRPRAAAVLALMANSNFVGCSTGISPGFVPRRILSTISAALRNRSG